MDGHILLAVHTKMEHACTVHVCTHPSNACPRGHAAGGLQDMETSMAWHVVPSLWKTSQPVMLPMAGDRCPGWPAPAHFERCFRCAPSPSRLAVKKISRKAKQKAAKEARKARKKDDDVSRAFKEADAGPDPEEQAHVQARERGYFIYAYQGLEEA